LISQRTSGNLAQKRTSDFVRDIMGVERGMKFLWTLIQLNDCQIEFI
jgi:hypothetical protein